MSKRKILVYQNYLQMLKNSDGIKMFQHLYLEKNGRKKDILENGRLSCAFSVSSILKMFDLIKSQHATIKGTLVDLLESGWQETKELKPGNLLLWEAQRNKNGRFHQHLGFYLGQNRALSNSSVKRKLMIHHYTFGRKKNGQARRLIVKILTHPFIKDYQL